MSRAEGGRGVPRGPPEWGELLHEPEWAGQRRWHDRFNLLFGLALLAVSVAALAAGLASWVRGPGTAGLVAIVGVSLLLCFLVVGLPLVVHEVRFMPLRLYDRGFTLERVPLLKGLGRQEVLVPAGCITRVELTTHGRGDWVSHTAKVSFRDDRGRTRSFIEWASNDEPFMRLLANLLPPDARGRLLGYLDEQDGRRARTPFPEESIPYRHGEGLGLFVVFTAFVLGPALMTGLLLGPDMLSDPMTFAFWGVMWLLFPLLLLVVLHRLTAGAVERAFYHEAVVVGGELVYEAPSWTKLLLRTRGAVPLTEVVSVKVVTRPHRTGTQGELLMTNGRRVKVSGQLVRRLEALGQFEREGDVLRNRWAGKSAGRPLAVRSAPRALAWVLAVVSLGPLIAYASPAVTPVEAGPMWGVAALLALCGAALALLGILVLQMMRTGGRERRLAEGMVVTKEGIRLPNAPERLRWVPSSRVASIRTGTGFYTNYTELRTPDGALRLSHEAAERLREGGYEVRDSAGRPTPVGLEKRWEARFEADLGGGGAGGGGGGTSGRAGGTRGAW